MIQVVIVSRDGCFSDRVWAAVNAATNYAGSKGLRAGWGVARYPYTVAGCRNKAVADFLSHTTYERLMFVDDDVVVPTNAVTALAEIDAGIAAGCYGSVRINPVDYSFRTAVWVRPTEGGEDTTDDGWLKCWPNGQVEAAAVGGGCMMVRREVFDKVEFPWFRWPEQQDGNGGIKCQSDDGDFCDRAIAAGVRIVATGDVRCGHMKTIDVSRLIGVINGA